MIKISSLLAALVLVSGAASACEKCGAGAKTMAAKTTKVATVKPAAKTTKVASSTKTVTCAKCAKAVVSTQSNAKLVAAKPASCPACAAKAAAAKKAAAKS